MSEFGSLQLPDVTSLPFAISSSNDHYVVSTKGSIAILQLRYKHINDDGALNYSVARFECSKEKPTSQLETREINVYNSSNREQRAKIMLDQTIIPKVATLYINNALAVPSPPGIFPDYNECLVAHLTNMGQLTLQRHDKVRNLWILYVDVSTTWIAHIYDGTVFDQFGPLSQTTAEALICAFCWRDVVFDHAAYFAFGTKSGKIAIYSLLSDSVRAEQIVGTGTDSVRCLKWVTITKEQNLLLAGLQSGRIALYSFRIQPDYTVVDCEQLADIWGDADALVVDHMQHEVDYDNKRVVLLVVKGTHLVATAFGFEGQIQSVTFHNMNNFSITGKKVDNLQDCYTISQFFRHATTVSHVLHRFNPHGLNFLRGHPNQGRQLVPRLQPNTNRPKHAKILHLWPDRHQNPILLAYGRISGEKFRPSEHPPTNDDYFLQI